MHKHAKTASAQNAILYFCPCKERKKVLIMLPSLLTYLQKMSIHFSNNFSLYSEILLFVHDDMYVIVCGRHSSVISRALFAFNGDAQHRRVSYLAETSASVQFIV